MKRGYSTNSSITSPPEKKPNIEEIKEYTEQHRMRKEIVAQEVDEEMDYFDGMCQNLKLTVYKIEKNYLDILTYPTKKLS